MSAKTVKVEMAPMPTCSVEGCSLPGSFMDGNRCGLHHLVFMACTLSPERFEQLRAILAASSPLTDEERRARKMRTSLSRLEWTSRDFKRAKKDSRDAGATEAQIAAAADKFTSDSAGPLS